MYHLIFILFILQKVFPCMTGYGLYCVPNFVVVSWLERYADSCSGWVCIDQMKRYKPNFALRRGLLGPSLNNYYGCLPPSSPTVLLMTSGHGILIGVHILHHLGNGISCMWWLDYQWRWELSQELYCQQLMNLFAKVKNKIKNL